MVYAEIVPHALELMNNVFGNYVIQKVMTAILMPYLFYETCKVIINDIYK